MAIETTTMTDEQRSALQAAIAGSENVTTGASPVIANIEKAVTRITTGGTGGNEDIYLPVFEALDPDGYTTVSRNGTIHSFVVDNQINGGDTVRIYQADADGTGPSSFDASDDAGNVLASIDFAVLDYQGATISFVWWDYNWFFINVQGNNDNEYTSKVGYVSGQGMQDLTASPLTTPADIKASLLWITSGGQPYKISYSELLLGATVYTAPAGTGGGSGQPIQWLAGAGNGNGSGGDLDYHGGAGAGTGNGGNVAFGGGQSGSGATGNGGFAELFGGDATSTDGNGGDVRLTPGAKAGSGVAGHVKITTGLESFADDAAAATGGVPVGGLYRTASAIKIRVT